MGNWSPPLGIEWLQVSEAELDEHFPRRLATAPAHRNGLPEPVPYTYRGSDFSEDGDGELTTHEYLEAAIWQAMRRRAVTTRHPAEFVDDVLAAIAGARTVPVREATPLDDPYLRYAGLPFSAPLGWLQDYEQGDR